MALNFPITPEDGDTYQGYVYDATAGVWNSDPHQIASRFVTSATAPSSPSEGDGWFDTNTAKSYVYYDGVWVQLGALGTVDLNQIADVVVSSPANGESLVYDGTDWVNQSVDIYDANSSSTGYFSMPKGTNAQRPVTPSNGDMRFNTDSGQPEWYSEVSDQWVLFKDGPTFDVQYLVIAGGGGSGSRSNTSNEAGGGGAGGYRSSVIGELSGRNSFAESTLQLSTSGYSVEVGAGGAGTTSTNQTSNSGSDSTFHTITSIGGGGGASFNLTPAFSGGSGGGGCNNLNPGGAGEVSQGFSGGTPVLGSRGGGGGGAGEAGDTDGTGAGGDGISSSITGTSIYRAGGGSGCNLGTSVPGGLGGGGSYSGTSSSVGESGGTGTGGGGAAPGTASNFGGAGGSGTVIIKYPSIYTANSSVGLTSITSIVGDYKVTQFTAGTGTVTFS